MRKGGGNLNLNQTKLRDGLGGGAEGEDEREEFVMLPGTELSTILLNLGMVSKDNRAPELTIPLAMRVGKPGRVRMTSSDLKWQL